MINDITGGVHQEMLVVAKAADCPIVLMHNTATFVVHTPIGAMYHAEDTINFWSNFMQELHIIKDRALEMGISKDNIILDAGLGFGKTVKQNLMILANIREIKALGCKVLLGPSQKSFIGHTLGHTVPQDRIFGTAACVALTVGVVDIMRVHDVAAMNDVVHMTKAVHGCVKA
jgi:dihydropteroate synthase